LPSDSLSALATQRAHAVEVHSRDLAAATARKDAAVETFRQLSERLDASVKRLEVAVADSDRIFTERGLRASERARMEDYRATEEALLVQMRRELDVSNAAVSAATAAEDTARAALERAIGDDEVLKRHRERIAVRERRAAEAESEEAHAEAQGAGIAGRSRGVAGS
jgi:hypothetical protein